MSIRFTKRSQSNTNVGTRDGAHPWQKAMIAAIEDLESAQDIEIEIVCVGGQRLYISSLRVHTPAYRTHLNRMMLGDKILMEVFHRGTYELAFKPLYPETVEEAAALLPGTLTQGG